MAKSSGFEPIAARDARVLILGTLPGQVSLARQEYYAQSRNAFWRIMGDLLGASPDRSYSERARILIDHGIALWDVCSAAHRPGSLDASIRNPEANDFRAFLADHPRVGVICFNGAKASGLFTQLVLPSVQDRDLRYETLPSTSPAHAAMPYEEKLARWSNAMKTAGAATSRSAS